MNQKCMRPVFIALLLIFLLGTAQPALLFGSAGDDVNVLLITIDTIRPDRLSCYSTRYTKTPNIDALAARGVLFKRAFAHNPMTLPSHVNIMLGAPPPFHGVHENSKAVVSKDFLTIAELLKEQGKSTAAFIGAFPLDSRFGLKQGFDVYDESYPSQSDAEFAYSERKAEEVVGSALTWLKRQYSDWFCWIHLWDAHAPYFPPPPFDEKYKNDPYSGEVAYIDSQLKRVFDFLDVSGIKEKTLVILTGDHGESLGEHGELTHSYFAYNSTLWIPLIIAGPGIESRSTTEYVCHLDIFPTICDFLDIKKPEFLKGISLMEAAEGKKIKSRAIFFESMDAYFNRGWAPLRGFIKDKTKFIETPIPEFYSLEEDFAEKNNRIEDIDLARYRKDLKDLEDASSSGREQLPGKTDSETLRRLRSLGYLASPLVQTKAKYGPEDDLKTLFPIQQKHSEALTLYEAGNTAAAVKLLNEIIKTRQDFDKSYIHLARIYTAQGLHKEARETMELGYRNNPKNYGIIASYGVLLVKQGLFDKGIAILQQALGLVDFDPETWTHLGIAYWRKKQYEKALESYDKALALDSSDAIIHNNIGSLFLSKFQETKNPQDHARAMESFKRAIGFDPTLPSAYNGLGSAYAYAGDFDAAISMWEKAVELKPDYDFPLYNLGMAYLRKRNKTKTIEYFQRYLTAMKGIISIQEQKRVEGLIREAQKIRNPSMS